MTITESAPTAVAEPAIRVEGAAQGLYEWLSTSDHKRIGRLWIHASLTLFLGLAVLGVVLGIERADTGGIDVFGGTNGYFQMWTLYRLGLVLLVAAPLFIGIAAVVVPMQVGSTNIAFPRAALGAAWVFIIGAGITIISVFAGGGWGALDGVSGDEADAIALTLVGTGMVLLALLMASICVATTVISLRPSGMNLMRVPLFAWSMLAACSVWLLTLPVAIANIALIYVDLRGGPLVFGNPEGSADIYAQLAWVVEQPQIYSFAIPVLGIVGSIAPVAAGIRHTAHSTSVVLIGIFAMFSIGGWSQPFFNDTTDELIFIVFGLVIMLPVMGMLATSVGAMRGARSSAGLPDAHVVGAIGATALLFGATIAGALRVVEPFELADTAAVTGVLNLVVLAAITGALAGVWFWAPKIGGPLLPAGPGRLAMLAVLAGAAVLGLADVIAGLFDADDLLLAAPAESIVDVLVVLALVGSVLVALGALGAALTVARGSGGEPAADDPWNGHTLEWATASPPSSGNFAEPPAKVTSPAPLLDVTAAGPDDGDDS